MSFSRARVSRSLVAIGAVSALVLSACSSGTESLRFVPGKGSTNEAASDARMAWGNVSYVVEGTLPTMPSSMASYKLKKQSAPTKEAERIAKTFGLDGPMIKDSTSAGEYDVFFEGYRIGSGDYTEPAMWMYGDGYWWTWSYYPGDVSGDRSGGGSSPSSGSSAGCAPDDRDCVDMPDGSDVPREREVSPTPPKNIPNTSETEALTIDMLTKIGVQTDDVRIDAYSDEWAAWSQASLLLNGAPSPISWSFSFGENGSLSYASGSLSTTSKSTSYKLADPMDAVARLSDYRYYGGYGAMDARDASVSSSVTSSKNATEMMDMGDDAVSDDVMPIDETIIDDIPLDETPQDITIPITSVEMSYTMMFVQGGAQLLMPAFTYSNDSGVVGTVVALSDDLFSFAEEPTPNQTDPGQPEPAPTDPGVPEPGVDDVIPAAKANALVGLSEEEAMKVAASSGWEYRVAARDGEQYMLTTDFVTNRVNVSIENGVITEVTVG
jgi:hypothetical protein